MATSDTSPPVNPYAPPTARVADVSSVDSQAEAIRREHIKHEASVRSVGILYYIGGALSVLGGLIVLPLAVMEQAGVAYAFAGALLLVFGAFALAVAYAIRQLKPWARTACIVLSVIGLLDIPVGTLISGYILYLLLAAKGKRIFQPDYAGIVAATPHIRYRTSIVVWILLAILVAGVAAGILVPMLSP